MKSRVLFAFLAVLLFVCVAIGQDKPPEPESIGVIYHLDPATQTLKRLPTEDYKKHRVNGMTITDNVVVSGTGSSFHIATNDKAAFIFKVFKDEQAGGVFLFRFTADGKKHDGQNREYELGRWHRGDYTPNRGLAVNVTKFGESAYKLVPETPLDPGEYALTCLDRTFTFSVGASGK